MTVSGFCVAADRDEIRTFHECECVEPCEYKAGACLEVGGAPQMNNENTGSWDCSSHHGCLVVCFYRLLSKKDQSGNRAVESREGTHDLTQF